MPEEPRVEPAGLGDDESCPADSPALVLSPDDVAYLSLQRVARSFHPQREAEAAGPPDPPNASVTLLDRVDRHMAEIVADHGLRNHYYRALSRYAYEVDYLVAFGRALLARGFIQPDTTLQDLLQTAQNETRCAQNAGVSDMRRFNPLQFEPPERLTVELMALTRQQNSTFLRFYEEPEKYCIGLLSYNVQERRRREEEAGRGLWRGDAWADAQDDLWAGM